MGLENTVKYTFYGLLHSSVSKVSAVETLVVCSNSHVGKLANEYEGIHGGHSYGLRNTEAERILKFAVAQDLAVRKSHFEKKDNNMISHQSGGSSCQIDDILVRKSDFKQVRNIKVIPGEDAVNQHPILVTDMK